MNQTLLHNIQILRPGIDCRRGYLAMSEGHITALDIGEPPALMEGDRVDGKGRLLTPGLIDLHTHGIHQHLYESGAEAFKAATATLGQYGVTSVAPTLVPKTDDAFLNKLSELSDVITTIDAVHIPGLHLESPFVAISGAACDTQAGDLGLLEALLSACKGRIAIMSISPEVPGILPVIERLVDAGVVPFITHTRADVAACQAAIDAGARHATHFYDVFPVPEETDIGVRPVGVVETVLAEPRATCDFIADGIHVHPVAIRAAVAAKGWQGVSLITDSSFGAGMPPGRYDTPWGYPVEVAQGNAPRIADPKHPYYDALAGSALTMNRGMQNLLDWLELPADQVWAMGTLNPATLLGLSNKGRLEVGMDADVVLWDTTDTSLEAVATWVGGKQIYGR